VTLENVWTSVSGVPKRWTLTKFLKKISSDEAVFYVKGHVNRQQFRYWSAVNLHWAADLNTQSNEKVMVWVAIWGDRIMVPFSLKIVWMGGFIMSY
jgi:hypothetical protein